MLEVMHCKILQVSYILSIARRRQREDEKERGEMIDSDSGRENSEGNWKRGEEGGRGGIKRDTERVEKRRKEKGRGRGRERKDGGKKRMMKGKSGREGKSKRKGDGWMEGDREWKEEEGAEVVQNMKS